MQRIHGEREDLQMRRIEQLLSEPEPFDIDKAFRDLSTLHMPSDIWNKICLYTQSICELGLGDLECGGYLMTDADRYDGVVTGVLYSPDQWVGSKDVTLSQPRRYYDMDKGTYLRPIGMWHVHPSFSTYPSPTDQRTLDALFNDFCERNISLPHGFMTESRSSPFSVSVDQERGVLRLVKGDDDPVFYEIGLDGLEHMQQLEGLLKAECKQIYGPGFFYSLIVSPRMDAIADPVQNTHYHLLLKAGTKEDTRTGFGSVTMDEPIGIPMDDVDHEIRSQTVAYNRPIDKQAYDSRQREQDPLHMRPRIIPAPER